MNLLIGLVVGNPINTNNPGQNSQFATNPAPSEKPGCRDCHSSVADKPIVHDPVNSGCDGCHQVNMAVHPESKSGNFFLAANTPGLCFTCHKELKTEIEAFPVQHTVVMEGENCMNCHSPHSSAEAKLLLAGKKEVCLGCHDKELAINGRKFSNIKGLLSKSKVIHSGLRGGCSTCHKAHGSEYPSLLINDYSHEFYAPAKTETFAICFECHNTELLELATTTEGTNFRNGDVNLHFVHMNEKKGRGCNVCHDVHASNNQFVIKEIVAFGKWEFKMNFSVKDSGGSCSPGCHQMEIYAR
jgi:predicted CXXCH cytochrome family protein